MNIGIAKLGGVVNSKNINYQGSKTEVVELYNILSKDNNVYFTTKVNGEFNKHKDEKLDLLFVFNGPISYYNHDYDNHKSITILKKYTWPTFEYINKSSIPYIYLQTDPRNEYSIERPKDLLRKPNLVLNMNNNFGHMDKFIIIGKNIRELKEKEIFFSVITNDTNKKRSNKILEILKWIKQDFKEKVIEIKGKWKQENEFNVGSIDVSEIQNYLDKVKYTVIIASDCYSVSQKIWECYISNVIAFFIDYDKLNNVVPELMYTRCKDEFDLYSKIEELEKNNNLYNEILQVQRSMVKEEYSNGEFLRNFYKNICYQLS